jgi:tetratricopeptide (TPR) repeat protein
MKAKRIIVVFLTSLIAHMAWSQNTAEGVLEVEKTATAYEVANSEFFMIEASKFFLLEDYEKALAHYEKAIALDEKNHAAYFKKAEILAIREDYDPALEAVRTAITLDPQNKYYYILAAQIIRQKEDVAELASIYKLMITNTNDWQIYGEEVVDALVSNEDYEVALSTIDQLFVFYPNYPELWLKKSEILLKSNAPEKSHETLAVAFEKFPDDGTVLNAYVKVLFSKGEYEQAETILWDRSKTDYKARILLLDYLTSSRKDERIKKLVIDNFNDDEASLETKILSIGYLFSAPEFEPELIDSLQHSLVITYADEALVLENGGFIYDQLAKQTTGQTQSKYFNKAIQSFKASATLNPNNFNLWLKVFEYEKEQAKWNDLQDDVTYLLDLYPNQPVLYYYLAAAYRNLNDTAEAFSLIDQGLRMSSRNQLLQSLLLSEKANIYVQENDAEKAEEFFRAALSTENIDERAIYDYASWLLTTDPKASIAVIETYSDYLNMNAKWVIVRAKAWVASDNASKARTICEDFLRTYDNTRSGELIELYGDILFQLGEIESALVQWQKALTLGGYSDKLSEKIANESINE